jgi:glycosyltransferase involved in cell wall biosynthesis
MKTPKVSVVIPNYNYAHYLEKRIRSVLNQTYKDFEVLYLDDASTDDSNKVFDRFAGDPRIRAIHNQVNSGSPFKQWNKGARHANGEYLWIAEADDYADEHLLVTLVDRLNEHPNAGIAYCGSWEVDESNVLLRSAQEVNARIYGGNRWQVDFVNDGRDECRRYLFVSNTIPNASAVLIRRALYEQVGGADPTFKLCGDWMLWTRILLISDVSFVAEPLNYWRQHAKTVRSRRNRDGLDLIESYRVMEYIAAAADVPEEVFEIGCNHMAALWFPNALTARLRLSRNRAVYRAARAVDPSILLRFPSTLATRLRYGTWLGPRH